MASNFANLTNPQQLAVFDQILGSTTSPTQGAGAIGYGGVTYPPGTIGYALQNSVIQTLLGFGAVGDGVTDDTAAIQTALNSGAVVLDGGNLTYRISAGLSKTVAAGGAFRMTNATIKSTGVADHTNFLNLTGPGLLSTCTISPVARGATSITLTSGTVVAGQWLRVAGTNLWSDGSITGSPSVTMGEWAYVLSVVGTTVTLANPLRYDYTTSCTAEVTGMAALIETENVTGISDNNTLTHAAVMMWYTVSGRAKNSGGYNCSYVGVGMQYSVYMYFEDCFGFDPSPSLALAYGTMAANTARQATHIRSRGRSCRHVATNGGTAGVIACATIIDAVGDAQNEAVCDAHPATDEFNVLFGNTGPTTSTNGKVVGSHARRMRVFGVQCEGVNDGVVWRPACTFYAASCEIHGDIKANHNAIDIENDSTQVVDSVICVGKFNGGIGGVSGDAVYFSHDSALVGTPGIFSSIIVQGHVIGQIARGVYLFGGANNQQFGDVILDGCFEHTQTGLGQRPIMANPTNLGDLLSLDIRGTLIGGDYGAYLANCTQARARVFARGYASDVFFNSRSADADALNRFDLLANITSTGGANNQHRGSVTANGASTVVVANVLARTGSRVSFSLVTVGGTPGAIRVSAISAGTSFSIVSTAGDTSTYNYVLENPVTGP